LLKNYVEKCYLKYLNTIQNIRHYVSEKKFWNRVNETTDVEGRYVMKYRYWYTEESRKF